MVKIAENFDFGDIENLDNVKLLYILDRMYQQLATAINRKPDVFKRDTDGQSDDTRLSDGDININTSTNNVQILASHDSSTTVTWKTL